MIVLQLLLSRKILLHKIYAQKYLHIVENEKTMSQRQRGKRLLKVKMPCGDADVESYQEACCAEELYIRKTWKQARDQQTEKFAGSFRLTYGCTFSLTFFAKRKCGKRCLTPLPLYIDWKQQEQEDVLLPFFGYHIMKNREWSVLKNWILWAAFKDRLRCGFFCVCVQMLLSNINSLLQLHVKCSVAPHISTRNSDDSVDPQPWRYAEQKKKSDESLILQSKRRPTIRVGEEAWGEYRVIADTFL